MKTEEEIKEMIEKYRKKYEKATDEITKNRCYWNVLALEWVLEE